jgi:hypothetical protein
MQEELPLTKLMHQHSLGLISRKDLEGHIFQFLLDNYQQLHPYGWSKDDYMDYVCAFYPRISSAIDNYRDQGATFDAYINSLVHWGSREHRTRETDHRLAEYACWKARALDEAAVHEEEDVYMEPEPAYGEVDNPRQILVLLLKSYHYMSPDFLERVSPALNIDKEKLAILVDELRKLRLRREEKIMELQERIHSQFYRCIVFQKKLKMLSPNSIRYEKMRQCLVRGQKRLAAMRRRMAGMKTQASNRQVAQILETSKGTVDAQLAAIKGSLGSPEDDDDGIL